MGKVPKFLIFTAALSLCSALQARADTTWDGVWKGYWHNRTLSTIEVRDGQVVDYIFAGRHRSVRFVESSPTTLSFHYLRNSVRLTRTGDASADGMQINGFNGRIHVGRKASGYGATSFVAAFVRE